MNSAFAKMSVRFDCWHKYYRSIGLISQDIFEELQQKGGVISVNFLADSLSSDNCLALLYSSFSDLCFVVRRANQFFWV